MATATLSAFGQAIGGPLGGAVGAVVGGLVDGPRRGPQSTLRLSSSSYGAPLARVHGCLRVPGHLVWAHELVSSGGKGGSGRGATASLAFLLSARPALDVRRIWADGRLWRDAEGRFETPVVMRFHGGHGAAAADPHMAAVEGGRAPAYRGRALVLFEALPLAPFGNRIPQLSFELVADEQGPIEWLHELAGDALEIGRPPAGDAPGLATGYAPNGGSRAQALDELAHWAGVAPVRRHGRPGLAPARLLALALDRLASPARGAGPARATDRSRTVERSLVTYLDVGRDYLEGVAMSGVAGATREQRLETSIAATATAASTLAAQQHARARAGAETVDLPLSWADRAIAAGDLLRLGTDPGPWRVEQRRIEGFAIRIVARRWPAPVGEATAADPGRHWPSRHRPVPATVLAVAELPHAPWHGGAPGLFVAAGGGADWRGARISLAGPGGPFEALATVDRPVAMGRLVQPLPSGPIHQWQEGVSLLLRFDDPDFLPETLDRPAVLSGAHRLQVGAECLQFREAAPAAGGAVRLSGLLRGRLGTEHEVSAHPAGAHAVLLPGTGLVAVPLTAARAGAELLLLAEGAGDPAGGTLLPHVATGAATAPLAPARLRALPAPGGGLALSWVHRERRAFEDDGASPGTPPGGWRVRIGPAGAPPFEALAAAPALLVPPGVAAAWSGPLQMEVEALGEGPSRQRLSRAVVRPTSL